MATETHPRALGELRSIHGSAGGLSLTTTLQTVGIPKGAQGLILEPRNFSTAVVARIALNPYLLVYKTTDALATVTNLTDYSDAAQDNDATTDVVLSSLDTNANNDALWIGSHLPFRGLSVDVDAANGTASVLSGTYWNGSALANISLTDNTASGGATFAQDGTITWSVPTAWSPASLVTVGGASGNLPHSGDTLYWVKLVVSAALDSSTTLNSLHALSRSTAYVDLTDGRIWEQAIRRGLGGIGSVEALSDAGTCSLLVTALTFVGGKFL